MERETEKPEKLSFQNDFILEIESILHEYEIHVSSRAILLANAILKEVYVKYGDEKSSEEYKQYHNHLHALSVLKRAMRLIHLINEKLPGTFSEHDQELLLIAAVGHDLVLADNTEEGLSETLSAEKVAIYMSDAGYTKEEAAVVEDAIIGTTVVHDEDTTIRQSRLCEGSKSKIKFVLAMADINGVAMEGPKAMFTDSFALFDEMSHQGKAKVLFNPVKLQKLLEYQFHFLRDRLDQRDDILNFFFIPEEVEIIKDVFHDEFKDTYADAYRIARLLSNDTNLMERIIRETLGNASFLSWQTKTVLSTVRRALIERLKK